MAKRSTRASLAQRVDNVTRGVRGRRPRARAPKFGALETKVDAILRAKGLELNAAPEKLLERTKRGGLFAADGSRHRKGEKVIRANMRKMKSGSLRPARGKRLRK